MDPQNDRSYKKIGRFFRKVAIGGFAILFCLLFINFFPVVIAIVAVMAFVFMIGWSLEQLYTSEEGFEVRNRIKTFFHDLIKGNKNENRKKQ